MIFFTCVCRIGDDAGAAHLRARARRGRHRDDGVDAGRVGPGPPVADVLEVPHRPGLPAHEGHHLAKVKAGAAAERNDAVMAAIAVDLEARLQVLLVRVGVDLGKHRPAQTRLVHQVERALGDLHVLEAAVGDQQRLGDAGLRASLADLGNAACAKADGIGIGPVGYQGHVRQPF
jgi:hypothetical protein